MKMFKVVIIHNGIDPNDREVRELRSVEKISAESPEEAIIVALIRTRVDRASMNTTITSIEVG